MANGFSKEETVAFDQVLEGFNDALVATKLAYVYKTNQTTMERANDTIWRPQPYIMQSFQGAPGTDQSANIKDVTQLSVPVSIAVQDTVPFALTALQLRDQLQEGRLGESAKQKLSSDINVALLKTASAYGSIVIAQSTAATGFDDISLIDATFDELGIGSEKRIAAFSPRDYNAMAGNLASRSLYPDSKSTIAYEQAYIGRVAKLGAYKLDYAQRLNASPGVAVTVNGANQFYVPMATTVGPDGVPRNVDNRFQTINVSATTPLAVGDGFHFAGVNSVHHITKQDTGQLKTFRVVAVPQAGQITITPPIISGQGGSAAELQYQNVTATPANGAAITPLNTTAAAINPFWEGEAMEIIPGRLVVPTDAGVSVMRGTTDDGIELVMVKQVQFGTLAVNYRFDTFFGTACKNPEMAGIMLFGQ